MLKMKIKWPKVIKNTLQEDDRRDCNTNKWKKTFLLLKVILTQLKKKYTIKLSKMKNFVKNYGAMDIKKTIFVKNRLMNLIIL